MNLLKSLLTANFLIGIILGSLSANEGPQLFLRVGGEKLRVVDSYNEFVEVEYGDRQYTISDKGEWELELGEGFVEYARGLGAYYSKYYDYADGASKIRLFLGDFHYSQREDFAKFAKTGDLVVFAWVHDGEVVSCRVDQFIEGPPFRDVKWYTKSFLKVTDEDQSGYLMVFFFNRGSPVKFDASPSQLAASPWVEAETVYGILRKNSDFRRKYKDWYIHAAVAGNVSLMRLFEADEEYLGRDRRKLFRTAWSAVLESKRREVLEHFLRLADADGPHGEGAKIISKGDVLYYSIKWEYFDIFEALVSRDSEARKRQFSDGKSPISAALSIRNEELFFRLIEDGFNTKELRKQGDRTAYSAMHSGFSGIAMSLWKEFGANPRYSPYSWTNMHGAARHGDLAILQYLKDEGVPVDKANSYGLTPLHLAISKRQERAVSWLLQNGAGKTRSYRGEKGLLFRAISSSSLEMYKLIEREGFERDVDLESGEAYFMYAVKQGEWEIASYLAEKGAAWSFGDWGLVQQALLFVFENDYSQALEAALRSWPSSQDLSLHGWNLSFVANRLGATRCLAVLEAYPQAGLGKKLADAATLQRAPQPKELKPFCFLNKLGRVPQAEVIEVRGVVDVDGAFRFPSVISDGGDPPLAALALDYAASLTFEPAVVDGKPVATEIKIPFRF